MASDFGRADVWVRQDEAVIVPISVVGARRDNRGVWLGTPRLDRGQAKKIALQIADFELGAALRYALLLSKNLEQASSSDTLSFAEFNAWLAGVFGRRTTSKLYMGMLWCDVCVVNTELTIAPSRRRRGGVFECFPRGSDRGHEHVLLPTSSSDAEIGAGLRLAISRCL